MQKHTNDQGQYVPKIKLSTVVHRTFGLIKYTQNNAVYIQIKRFLAKNYELNWLF